jgi:hypothetical protein
MCIGTEVQKQANHINTPSEKQVMFNVNFLKVLTQFSSIPSYFVNKSMAPEHVQKAFQVLANKLAKEDFDSSATIIFWFLSLIFKVRICIVRVKKSKSRGDDFIL